jgi:hypothetical protein
MSTKAYVPEQPLIKGKHTYSSITALVGDIVERPTPMGWYIAFGISNNTV